jgi:nucleotidyltransferase/DNA polymerase involved in DNA repair
MLLCVVVPNYPLAVALREFGTNGEAVLVADKLDRGRVLALDARAYDAGARIGQTVAQASAAAHGARVLVHDAQHARTLWDELLDTLDALSPLVDDAALGVAHLDMHGVAGTPQAWIARAHRVLADIGLPIRVALGPNKFVARAAALVADGTIAERDDAAALLAPLALDVLDLDPRTHERLRLLGIGSLGQLADLPHGPFVRRFGPMAAAWHDRARGIDPTPFLPRSHALAIEAAMFGEGSAQAEAQLVFALRILLDRVCADLERLGKRTGTLRVELELENGDASVRDVGLAQPTAEARPMLDVLRANLENVTFAAPVVGLRVRALRLEEGGATLPLFSGGDPDPQAVAVTLARLEALLGEPARRARDVRAYALEGQFAYDPFALPISALPVQPELSSARLAPQLQLLEVREIAVRVLAGVPAFVGSPPRAVLECTGPWRIEEGWFDVPLVRDEYDVLLDDGALYRIYRQGLCWYMRGAYD